MALTGTSILMTPEISISSSHLYLQSNCLLDYFHLGVYTDTSSHSKYGLSSGPLVPTSKATSTYVPQTFHAGQRCVGGSDLRAQVRKQQHPTRQLSLPLLQWLRRPHAERLATKTEAGLDHGTAARRDPQWTPHDWDALNHSDEPRLGTTPHLNCPLS